MTEPNTQVDTDNRGALLLGHGRIPWQTARDILSGSTCAWADLGGFHTGTPPTAVPLASHLWAWWPDGRCARARIDDDSAYLAILHSTGTTAPPAPHTTRVTVRRHHDVPVWQIHDTEAGPLPPETRAWTYDLLEVTGESPITFVHGVLDDGG